LEQETIDWLLDDENPSLKYRVLTELLDQTESSQEVKEAKSLIKDSRAVTSIFEKMHPDGYWLQKNPRTKEITGDGVVYGAFATTHFCLSYLSELGLTKDHPMVKKAAERYLNLMQDDGDWWEHLSCLNGYNIRTFIKLGYKNDKRLQKTINLMLNTSRKDGGYLCDLHERSGKNKKSCIRGSAKTLMAFAELPELWEHERCKQLVDYFLNRNGIFKNKDKTKFVNKDMITNSFPIIWRTGIWEILYALSKMGLGKDKRLNKAWARLDKQENENGKYILHWDPAQSPWRVGKRKEANDWLTFYILLTKKYREEFAK